MYLKFWIVIYISFYKPYLRLDFHQVVFMHILDLFIETKQSWIKKFKKFLRLKEVVKLPVQTAKM